MSAVDPRLLRAFVAVAEELHFGRAAERLHLAQPAVSQQLRKLETQLGVKLFERTRHYVRLTAAGEAALPYARQTLAAAAAVRRAAQDAADGAPTVVRVGLSPGVHYLAERVVAHVAEDEPRVRVRAVAASTGALAVEVAAGELELALGFECAPTHGVRVSQVADVPAVAAFAGSHPLATRETVTVDELAGQTFALVDAEEGPGYNAAVRALCRDAGFEATTVDDPSGPMAWETAVRSRGCVGLTSRISAASTLRGIVVVPIVEDLRFSIDLLTPDGGGDLSPVAGAFARAAAVATRARRPR